MKHLIFAAFAISFLATPAFADQATTSPSTEVTVDLSKLDSNSRNAILDNIAKDKKDVVSAAADPDAITKWSQVGKGVGDAIAAAAKALNTGVNDFIKTPAGTLVVWTLLAYLFGAALWHVAGGVFFWFVIVSLILWSFNKFHVQKVVWDKTRTTPTVVKYEFNTRDARATSACAHVIAFVVTTIVCFCIIF